MIVLYWRMVTNLGIKYRSIFSAFCLFQVTLPINKHRSLFLPLSESLLSLAQSFNINLQLLLWHFHWIEIVRDRIIGNLRIGSTFLHRNPWLNRRTVRTFNVAIVELIGFIHHVLLWLPHIRQIRSYSNGARKIIIDLIISPVLQSHLQWLHLIP